MLEWQMQPYPDLTIIDFLLRFPAEQNKYSPLIVIANMEIKM